MQILEKRVTNHQESKYLAEPCFLQKVLENLGDGVLILTETGELVHANTRAYNICEQINQSSLNSNSLPFVIWNTCKLLIENQADNSTMLSEDITVQPSIIFRIRVRRLHLELSEQSYLLVTIENRDESLKNVAFSEANKYNLTQREAEIWTLYRATSSYKQIAQKLYITVNTVKKHIKNIRAKQQRLVV